MDVASQVLLFSERTSVEQAWFHQASRILVGTLTSQEMEGLFLFFCDDCWVDMVLVGGMVVGGSGVEGW